MRGYEAWPHQVDALERAQRENIILNLPTGTGKTLVACLVIGRKSNNYCRLCHMEGRQLPLLQFHDVVIVYHSFIETFAVFGN